MLMSGGTQRRRPVVHFETKALSNVNEPEIMSGKAPKRAGETLS